MAQAVLCKNQHQPQKPVAQARSHVRTVLASLQRQQLVRQLTTHPNCGQKRHRRGRSSSPAVVLEQATESFVANDGPGGRTWLGGSRQRLVDQPMMRTFLRRSGSVT